MKKICISKDWSFLKQNSKERVTVDLPHDYLIASERNPKSAGGGSNGYFDALEGSYSKYIDFGSDEHVILDIDGAYMCTRVYLNENQLVMHPHGYTPFLTDLTPKMRKNKVNKIEITTQNIQPSTRWYSGAGIYRDVYLWTGGSVRIEPWDLFITTENISDNNADILAKADITSDISGEVILKIKISNPKGEAVIEDSSSITVQEGKNGIELKYNIENSVLWDIETPELYTIRMEIIHENKIEDTYEMNFGIRTISADAANGLLLNGKPVKLRGGCIHHDHGALGAAAFPAAEYRKLSKLKEVGFNAIRTAHNPPSLALLEICDRMGMLVMDEAFDMWNLPKNGLDYSLWFADWWDRDIKSMVMRDRNHPCVISYSIGNEIRERNCMSDGDKWSKKLSDEIRKYDKTRLVTSGICGMWMQPEENAPEDYKEYFMQGHKDIGEGGVETAWNEWMENYIKPLDIAGINYLYERYEYDHEIYPDRVMWGSETHVLNFYHSWQTVMNNSYVIGDFTWTAYDNLGEAGTGRFSWERDGVIKGISIAEYPWRSCYQGDFDLCGYRRPQSYFRESIWKKDCEPKIFTTHPEHYGEGFTGTGWHWHDVSDSWTFDDKYIGKPVKTEVYSDADEVHFILNGRNAGIVKPVYGIAETDIPYEKGTLTAVSYRDGKKIKQSSLHTVGKAEKIKVFAEKESITADNRDLCYFDIYVTDQNGDTVPFADNELTCICDGGELMCIFSGNPANEDSYTSNKCHAFKGKAVAVVRTKEAGSVKITVGGKNLKSDFAEIKAK